MIVGGTLGIYSDSKYEYAATKYNGYCINGWGRHFQTGLFPTFIVPVGLAQQLRMSRSVFLCVCVEAEKVYCVSL